MSPFRRLPVTLTALGLSLLGQEWSSRVPLGTFFTVKSWVVWDLPALQAGRLWAPFLRLWIQPDPGVHWGSLVMVLVGLGCLELRRGSRAAALGFFVAGPLATICCTLFLWPVYAAGMHNLGHFLFIGDVGSSSDAMLCWALFLRSLPTRWGVVGMLITAPIVLQPFTLTAHQEFAFDHFFAFEAGLVAGPWLLNRPALRLRPVAPLRGAATPEP